MEEEENGQTSNKEESGYSQYGITNLPKTSVATSWGQTKTLAGLSAKELVFLIVTTLNILTAVGLTLYRFVKVIKEDPEQPDFTFALLLLINALFCFFYAFHGVLREKIYELYVLIIAILVIVTYCLVEYAFLNVKGRTTLKLVRVILAFVLGVPNIYLAWAVAKHFGYLQFRIVGASEYLQHLYEQASIFSCGLKFDVQVTVSIVVLVLRQGTKVNLAEQIILGIGIPYSLLWNVLGWVMLTREWKGGAYLFAVLGLVKPAYYIFRIVEDYRDITCSCTNCSCDVYSSNTNTIMYSMLAAGALGILVWLVLMIELYIVYKNFGKGLKERAFDVLATESTSLITGRKSRRENMKPGPVPTHAQHNEL